MRTLTDHIVPGDAPERQLTIEVLDEAGYEYAVLGGGVADFFMNLVRFRSGPLTDGVTDEALLAILIDRLKCHQEGSYADDDAEHALYHVRHALHWLQRRTRERIRRGVEGRAEK